MTSVVPAPLSGLLTTTHAYGTTGAGPNRLLSTITKDSMNATRGSTLFSYNADGAMTARRDGIGNALRTVSSQRPRRTA